MLKPVLFTIKTCYTFSYKLLVLGERSVQMPQLNSNKYVG